MIRAYYYLAASLADVRWGGGPPRGTLEELIEYLEPELAEEDAEALRQVFLFNDMRNAVSYRPSRGTPTSFPSSRSSSRSRGATRESIPIYPQSMSSRSASTIISTIYARPSCATTSLASSTFGI